MTLNFLEKNYLLSYKMKDVFTKPHVFTPHNRTAWWNENIDIFLKQRGPSNSKARSLINFGETVSLVQPTPSIGYLLPPSKDDRLLKSYLIQNQALIT